MIFRASAIAFLLSGCTTWVHPTKSRADLEMDTYLCRKDASAASDPDQSYEITRRCLMAKGWRRQ